MKSQDEPAKWRPSTSKPWMKAPSTMPCAKVATVDPIAEAAIPERQMLSVAEAELEGDAAEDQRQQHHHDREIDGRDDDGEGERKGGEQRQPAQHQPSLVAVPDRRDRVHHQVARFAVALEAVEHADAEVEAVEDDVEADADAKDQRPERHEVEDERLHRQLLLSSLGSASTGRAGRPLSMASVCLSAAVGPLRASRAMMVRPAG